MVTTTLSTLERNIEIADQLRAWRGAGFEPQDLPEPFGGVVRSIDRILELMDIPALLCGDWAVWRYGYPRRISEDLDIILPDARGAEFIASACARGFVDSTAGRRWPKLMHFETKLQVDILPESLAPGLGGNPGRLQFIDLASLVVMKLAADRPCDRSDMVELLLANPGRLSALRGRATLAHPDYAAQFDALLQQSRDELEN